MLALYRSGRQTEALEAFRRLRAELVEALGIEPGTETRELEAAILRHDPMLVAPRRPGDEASTRRAIPPRPSTPVTAAESADRARHGRGDCDGNGRHRRSPRRRRQRGTPDTQVAYRAQIVRVCQAVNAAERARQRDEAVLRRALARGAHNPIAARRDPRDHARDDLPQRAQPGRPPVAPAPRCESRSAPDRHDGLGSEPRAGTPVRGPARPLGQPGRAAACDRTAHRRASRHRAGPGHARDRTPAPRGRTVPDPQLQRAPRSSAAARARASRWGPTSTRPRRRLRTCSRNDRPTGS